MRRFTVHDVFSNEFAHTNIIWNNSLPEALQGPCTHEWKWMYVVPHTDWDSDYEYTHTYICIFVYICIYTQSIWIVLRSSAPSKFVLPNLRSSKFVVYISIKVTATPTFNFGSRAAQSCSEWKGEGWGGGICWLHEWCGCRMWCIPLRGVVCVNVSTCMCALANSRTHLRTYSNIATQKQSDTYIVCLFPCIDRVWKIADTHIHTQAHTYTHTRTHTHT